MFCNSGFSMKMIEWKQFIWTFRCFHALQHSVLCKILIIQIPDSCLRNPILIVFLSIPFQDLQSMCMASTNKPNCYCLEWWKTEEISDGKLWRRIEIYWYDHTMIQHILFNLFFKLSWLKQSRYKTSHYKTGCPFNAVHLFMLLLIFDWL